jgi:hypothetical protein
VFCDEPQRHCRAVDNVLEEHILHVEDRIRQLTRLSKELRQLRGVCLAPGTVADCQILIKLRKDRAPTKEWRASPRRARASHG